MESFNRLLGILIVLGWCQWWGLRRCVRSLWSLCCQSLFYSFLGYREGLFMEAFHLDNSRAIESRFFFFFFIKYTYIFSLFFWMLDMIDHRRFLSMRVDIPQKCVFFGGDNDWFCYLFIWATLSLLYWHLVLFIGKIWVILGHTIIT